MKQNKRQQLWNNTKNSNLGIIKISEGEKNTIGQKKYLKK